MLYLCFEELSGGTGGIILIILLMIITAVVFAIKFAIDIALNKRFAPKGNEEKNFDSRGNEYFYAIKNEPQRRKRPPSRPPQSSPQYTIIPQDKLFILENPSKKDKKY